MKNVLTGLAIFAASATALAAQPLLTPQALASISKQDDVRIIDSRPPKAYALSHLHGAVNAPYGKWRGPSNNPGELPPLKKLTELVQSLGLTPQTHAVIVSSGANDTDFGASARVYWTLKVLGLKNLSILNGGFKSWETAKLPTDKDTPNVARSSFEPTIDAKYLITRQSVLAQTQDKKAILVDARPADFFNGETRHVAAKIPGTLPNAVNLPHATWFKPGTSQVVDADQAKGLAAKYSLANNTQEIVSFCNTGHWAATNWFVLSELVGDEDVKLYAGSMVDWTQASDSLPLQNVPGRFKQLMIDAKIWFAGL